MHDEIKLSEPDLEGQMARSELYRAAKHAMKLFEMIQDGQQLEGWVQAKITMAADYLDTIYHYMEYQMKFGNGGVATRVDDITSEADMQPAEEEIEEPVEVEESLTYEEKLQALLEGRVAKLTKEDMKVGDTKKIASGTVTKTKTGIVHKSSKAYGGSEEKADDSDDEQTAKKKKKKVGEASTGDYSAKKARAGKDIGKPGKEFSKISKDAAKRYGSKEKGEKVAGAVLAKLRKG